ncbi:MAG: thioredoxin [Firmicutes bacterium]|nr:thioredoxin [Bacillota bacterium]
MITNVTKDTFNKEIEEAKETVLVDFWAAWCMPCKMLSPAVDAIAEERADVKVCKINIDEEPELAIRFGVMSIPTLIVFKDGEVANKSVGLISKEDILALL